jgi:hypothetical protein
MARRKNDTPVFSGPYIALLCMRACPPSTVSASVKDSDELLLTFESN